MKTEKLTCESARSICIVKTLAKLGHFPNRTTEKEAWFLSPLRSETQASFKVSIKLNRWYDFGRGEGGNVLDLIVSMKNCSVKQALEELNKERDHFSFQQPILKANKSSIVIFKIKQIQHQALIKYLDSRKIPITIARTYCREVWYRINGKQYFALGLQNHLRGCELRNKYFKGSTSPKSYSYLNNNSDKLLVFEGMFDLLSLAELFPDESEHSDVIVLNSLSFIELVRLLFKNYEKVYLYLDNDQAGNKYSKELIQNYKHVIDKSDAFKGYKDLNEKLIYIRREIVVEK